MTRFIVLAITLICNDGILFSQTASHSYENKQYRALQEPNMEIAKTWWPDLTDFWTPIGWKHHRFRFNFFFDGTLYADPGLSQTAKKWKGQGVEIHTMPERENTAIWRWDKIRNMNYELEDNSRTKQDGLLLPHLIRVQQSLLLKLKIIKKLFWQLFGKLQKKTKTWKDDVGVIYHLVPTSLHGNEDITLLHTFYLDTEPLQLVFAGLMEANDPLMKSTIEWFRNGPLKKGFARYNSDFWQTPFLVHEMSSCIPGYSWNLFYDHQLGDRYHFLEGMYSQYAGAISRQTKTICESRGGITGGITHADAPFYMTRLAIADDLIKEGELHLLRLCPVAWISKNQRSKFENMPTDFGPVTLEWQLSKDGRMLNVTYRPRFYNQPKAVYFYIPPVKGLNMISVNGKRYSIKQRTRFIL